MMQQLYLPQHVSLRSKFHFIIATLTTVNITHKQHLFVIHQYHHSLKPLIYSLIFETQVCEKHKLSNYICKYLIVLHTLFFIRNLSSCTLYYWPIFLWFGFEALENTLDMFPMFDPYLIMCKCWWKHGQLIISFIFKTWFNKHIQYIN
jgi:hypothetical protein